MEQVSTKLRRFIDLEIWIGFACPEAIREDASLYALEALAREDLDDEINRLLQEAIEHHAAEQAGWGSITDCDRLNQAFAALEEQGIVARQHFTCCNNCGHTEIWDEIEEAANRQSVQGYTVYHFQGTQRVLESNELMLAYGSVAEEETTLVEVARKIVTELQRAGLAARWEGTVDYPVIIEGIRWQRRR